MQRRSFAALERRSFPLGNEASVATYVDDVYISSINAQLFELAYRRPVGASASSSAITTTAV